MRFEGKTVAFIGQVAEFGMPNEAMDVCLDMTLNLTKIVLNQTARPDMGRISSMSVWCHRLQRVPLGRETMDKHGWPAPQKPVLRAFSLERCRPGQIMVTTDSLLASHSRPQEPSDVFHDNPTSHPIRVRMYWPKRFGDGCRL
jgi:hypothetical protein